MPYHTSANEIDPHGSQLARRSMLWWFLFWDILVCKYVPVDTSFGFLPHTTPRLPWYDAKGV